jgi:hypothetical protein
MKISKLLPIALAFTLCTTGAFAASNDANTEYSLTVSDFLNITYDEGSQSSSVKPQLNCEDDDYTIAKLETTLTEANVALISPVFFIVKINLTWKIHKNLT